MWDDRVQFDAQNQDLEVHCVIEIKWARLDRNAILVMLVKEVREMFPGRFDNTTSMVNVVRSNVNGGKEGLILAFQSKNFHECWRVAEFFQDYLASVGDHL